MKKFLLSMVAVLGLAGFAQAGGYGVDEVVVDRFGRRVVVEERFDPFFPRVTLATGFGRRVIVEDTNAVFVDNGFNRRVRVVVRPRPNVVIIGR